MDFQKTVFVVDDDPDVRRSLKAVFHAAKLGVETYDSAEMFLQRANLDAGACLILDMRMPGLSGLELQERLQSRGAPIPIIFLTAYGEVSAAVEAMSRGAHTFLEKPLDHEVLMKHVHAAMGERANEVRRRADLGGVHARLAALSQREREVLGMVVMGQSNKQIAHCLGLSEKTISHHRAHMLEKTGAPNTVALVRLATILEMADTT